MVDYIILNYQKIITKKIILILEIYHFGKKLFIAYNGQNYIASKGNRGAGGPEHPKIALHANLAKQLGFDKNKGSDYVTIKRI